eukprot:3376741-Rhodomonas_salina.3
MGCLVLKRSMVVTRRVVWACTCRYPPRALRGELSTRVLCDVLYFTSATVTSCGTYAVHGCGIARMAVPKSGT